MEMQIIDDIDLIAENATQITNLKMLEAFEKRTQECKNASEYYPYLETIKGSGKILKVRRQEHLNRLYRVNIAPYKTALSNGGKQGQIARRIEANLIRMQKEALVSIQCMDTFHMNFGGEKNDNE